MLRRVYSLPRRLVTHLPMRHAGCNARESMRALVLAIGLWVAACGTDHASCRDCAPEHPDPAQPAVSSQELERELDAIESEIAGDAGQ